MVEAVEGTPVGVAEGVGLLPKLPFCSQPDYLGAEGASELAAVEAAAEAAGLALQRGTWIAKTTSLWVKETASGLVWIVEDLLLLLLRGCHPLLQVSMPKNPVVVEEEAHC